MKKITRKGDKILVILFSLGLTFLLCMLVNTINDYEKIKNTNSSIGVTSVPVDSTQVSLVNPSIDCSTILHTHFSKVGSDTEVVINRYSQNPIIADFTGLLDCSDISGREIHGVIYKAPSRWIFFLRLSGFDPTPYSKVQLWQLNVNYSPMEDIVLSIVYGFFAILCFGCLIILIL